MIITCKYLIFKKNNDNMKLPKSGKYFFSLKRSRNEVIYHKKILF